MSAERFAEVRNWLQKYLSLAETIALLANMDSDWDKAGVDAQWLAYFEKEFRCRMQSGDEFWLYDSGPASWANLCGERGLALLRNGEVLAVMVFAMN